MSLMLFLAAIVAGCDRAVPLDVVPRVDAATRDPANAADYTETVNDEPMFAAQGQWSSGYVLARKQGVGVVVGPGGGNPNVFAQGFAVQPGQRFKVRARASAAKEGAALARIQVNWTDSQGRFLSVSSQVFEVSAADTLAELLVEAPAGSTTGTLYVVAHGDENVVRYTEMRLLRPAPPGLAARVATPDAGRDEAELAAIPRPPNLTPIEGSRRQLSAAESQYYFYHATKALQRRTKERAAAFVMYVMPDHDVARLWPAIEQLRREGIKVVAYEPRDPWTSGVDPSWYWQQADSHWTEAAVRLAADEILRLWTTSEVANRPYSADLAHRYDAGFPPQVR